MHIKEKFPIEKLPTELLTLVLFYAADLQYLSRLSQLSKQMNSIIRNAQESSHMKAYFYELYRRDFPNNNKKISFDKEVNYKKLYKKASQERTKEDNKFSKKQRKLFSWIRSGDLHSIEREKLGSEKNFIGYLGQAVLLASSYKRRTILEYFYYQICPVVFSTKTLDAKRRTKLYWAAACGIVSEISKKNNREFVNQVVANGETMLFVAVNHGHLDVVQALLKANAEVDQSLNDGATPLFVAAYHGDLEVVQALLEANAKVDQPRIDGATPLFIAAEKGNLEVVQVLLKANAKVDQSLNDGTTPLLIAADQGNLEVVQALLKANAKVDQPLNDGATPLFVAVHQGDLKVVQTLLKANAKVDQPRIDRVTPLYTAVQHKHLEIVKALLAARASVDQHCGKYGTPLFMAARKGYLEIVQALLDANANVDELCIHHETPFSIANKYDQQKVFALLKLWQIKTLLKDKPLSEIVVAILEAPTQTNSVLNLVKSFKQSFFSNTNPLATLIAKLKIQNTQNELNKETLINILEQNRSIIPSEKYEFIFKYFLADENQKSVRITHTSYELQELKR